jgi:hypothetical protein
LYSSLNIFRMIQSKGLKWARNVAGVGRRGILTDFCGKPRRKETTRKAQTQTEI